MLKMLGHPNLGQSAPMTILRAFLRATREKAAADVSWTVLPQFCNRISTIFIHSSCILQNKMPSEVVSLKFAKLTQNASTPTKGSALSAGYDLYSAYDCIIPAKGKEIVKTDLQIALPDGCYGRVAPRSGLAAKHFIDVGAGVIDQDYRGNVGVVLFNFSDQEFEVKKGDRVAQLICERIYLPELEELPTLDNTERGSGGFGSTGKN